MQFLKLRQPIAVVLLSAVFGNAVAQNLGFDPPEGFKDDIPAQETKIGHLTYLKTYYGECIIKDAANKDSINPNCTKFKQVKDLTIKYSNPLEDISWVKYFTKLENLTATFNYIKVLPDTFPSTLKSLNLYGNAISIPLNGSFSALPAGLENLSLGGQWRGEIKAIPALPKNLKSLDISYGKITTLPDSFPSGLVQLALNENQIQATNAALANSQIKYLNLSYNKLTAADVPLTIKELYLSNNLIGTINLSVFPDSLSLLDVSNNQLVGLPTQNQKLEFLNADNNKITSLGSLSAGLSQLSISGNKLVTLPSLPNNIKYIKVSKNLLTTLPSIPASVESLLADSNKISALPTLSEGLRELDFSSNNLSGSLAALPQSLTVLKLSYTNITSFVAPANLGILHFSKTKVTSFPGSVIPSVLGELFCDNNNLASIPALPSSLYRIKAKGNQFNCLPNLPENLDDSDIQLVCNKNCWATLYGDWNDASNWSQNLVPTANDDVLVINGSPNINADNLNVKNLDIRNSVVQGPYALTVKGNIVNNGSFFNYPVIMAGTASQTITGKITTVYYHLLGEYAQNLDHFKHLIINNSKGVIYAGTRSIDTLSVLSGFIDANLDTIQIGALGVCNVSVLVKNGYIGYSQPIQRGWSFIGNPMANQNLKSLNSSIPLGFGGSKQSIYTYDGTTLSANGWVAAAGLNDPFSSGKGFRVYSQQTSGVRFVGVPFAGTKDLNVTFDAAGYDNGGWNLVANPYLSTIDWAKAQGWTKTNMTGGIYIWNPAKGAYASYVNGAGTNDGSRYIAIGQAFFVKASAANPKLIINESAKSSSQASFLRTGVSLPALKISLNDKVENHVDELLFRVADGATDNFDIDFDAYKLPGTFINISTKSTDGELLSINSLPELTGNYPIALSSARTGKFTFTFSGTSSLVDQNAYLTDKLLGKEIALSDETEYEFTVNSTDTPDRFRLSFTSVITSTSGTSTESAPSVYPNPAKDFVILSLGTLKGADAVLVNPLGSEIASWSNILDNSVKIPLNSESGIYILKVKSNEELFVYKIVKH